MASGLALDGPAPQPADRRHRGPAGRDAPENQRMMNLLDIHVETVTPEQVQAFDRIAMVDVQPHYFGGAIDRVDLVIDHHPEQPGYNVDLQRHPRRTTARRPRS